MGLQEPEGPKHHGIKGKLSVVILVGGLQCQVREEQENVRAERITVDQVALTFIFNEPLIVTYNEERRVNLLGLCLRKELGKGLGQSKAIY